LKTKKRELDQKDIEILSALKSLGGKAPTKQLSSVLGIPTRTIRYRLAQLRKQGHLKHLLAQTHDIVLGLGESIIVMDLKENTAELAQLFDIISPIYLWSPTYGKYNGFIIHSVYPVGLPGMVHALLRSLHQAGIVTDYSIFYITDYTSTMPDFSMYTPKLGWTWDWKKWTDGCIRDFKKSGKATLELEYDPRPIESDWKDIEIIRQLKMNARIRLKRLGEIVSLSESQAGARVRRLESLGVIKGYRWVIEDLKEHLFLYCFVELEESESPIMSCFTRLPFPKEIYAEDRRRFCVRLMIPSTELADFYRGFDHVKNHFRSFFFQTMHDPTDRQVTIAQLYNKRTECWEIRPDEFTHKVEEFIRSQGN
jgi:DNA-binding Lrp family transcriptional regulator